jgi:hypothetical protein
MTPRAKFLLLASLFLAPLVAAVFVFFFVPQWWPSRALNYGTLVDPARPLPPLALVDADRRPATARLQQKWTVVYLGGPECAAACAERLRLVRQVRLRLNEKGVRVQYAYVAPRIEALAAARDALFAEHPGMLLLADAGAPGGRAADFFQPTDPDALYLLDPLANWLMVYSGAVDPVGLLADLKKLLRYSHLG